MGVLRSDRVSGLGGANAINGSVFFPQNSYINVDPDSDFDFPGDFTIEMWVRNLAGPNMSDHQRQISSKNYYTSGSDGNWYFGLNESSSAEMKFYSYDGQGSGESVSGNIATPDRDRWYHIAAARSGSTLKVFLDGSEEGSGTFSKGLDDGGNNGLFIGGISKNKGTDSYGDHYGWISNLRIVKGRALYTADFTVPTGRLEKTSDTVLLCFQSPGNVLEEKTGKILSHNNHDTTGASKEVSTDRLAPDVGEDHGTTFADGAVLDTLSYMVPPGGTTAQSNRGRGVFAGGETPSKVNSIEYVNIQSMGTSKDFGDLTITSGDVKGLGSSTRGVFRADNNPTSRNVLEYVTFATTSNATDFGDLNVAIQQRPGAGNQTRGIFSGGLYPGSTFHTDMDYITIASTGNAADFGNLSVARGDASALASPTRMVVAGGVTNPGSATYMVDVDYVTIATIGNATDFGDLTVGRRAGTAAASSTRGVFGPARAPSLTNVIDYITIASTGNATDFGDALVARGGAGSASNSIRGLFAGGYSPSLINGIEFITIASTGNGADFGDMTFVSQYGGGCSDSHGGIS